MKTGSSALGHYERKSAIMRSLRKLPVIILYIRHNIVKSNSIIQVLGYISMIIRDLFTSMECPELERHFNRKKQSIATLLYCTNPCFLHILGGEDSEIRVLKLKTYVKSSLTVV